MSPLLLSSYRAEVVKRQSLYPKRDRSFPLKNPVRCNTDICGVLTGSTFHDEHMNNTPHSRSLKGPVMSYPFNFGTLYPNDFISASASSTVVFCSGLDLSSYLSAQSHKFFSENIALLD